MRRVSNEFIRRCASASSLISWFALGLTACLIFVSLSPGEARESRWHKDHQPGQTAEQREKKSTDKKNQTAATPTGPFFAVVSIADQRISVYGANGLVARAPVSTGMRGHPTPTGVFAIIQKKRLHHSNIYSNAPMPYMQRITWSGVALHAGVLPGYPASHGCIRMPREFAEYIYGFTKVGQRVIVSPRDITPVAITHKKLPVPKLYLAQEGATQAAGDDANGKLAGPAPGTADPVQPSGTGEIERVGLNVDTPPVKQLNPVEFAQAMKAQATTKSAAAAKAAKAARALVSAKEDEASAAARALKTAEAAKSDVEDQLSTVLKKAAQVRAPLEAKLAEVASKAAETKASLEAKLAEAQKKVEEARQLKEVKDQELTAAQPMPSETGAANAEASAAAKVLKAAEVARSDAEAQLTAAEKKAAEVKSSLEAKLAEVASKAAETKALLEAKLAEAQKKVEEARQLKEVKDQELIAAQRVVSEAENAGKEAAERLKEAYRRLSPVSIFISSATGRLYVRQAMRPLFDVPVTIKQSERPIGTHVYISTGAEPDGSALRWLALSMPAPEVEKKPRQEKTKRKRSIEDEVPAAASLPPETAAGALDRVEIPEETAQRIGELSWIGASLIISDQGISEEMDDDTDFVVLTRTRASAP